MFQVHMPDLQYQQIFPLIVYVNLKVPSFSVENSPTLKLKYPYVNKTYLHKGLNEGD